MRNTELVTLSCTTFLCLWPAWESGADQACLQLATLELPLCLDGDRAGMLMCVAAAPRRLPDGPLEYFGAGVGGESDR